MHPIRTTTTRTNRAAGLSAIAAGLALTAAACGSSGSPAASGSSHHPMASRSRQMSHAATSVFGSDCGMVPAAGLGSLHGMSMDPVVIAATRNPLLSDLARAIKGAGLAGTLDSMHAVTVFAPANSAFSKLHGPAMTMLHNRADLAKILKYHVVDGRITPARIAAGQPLKTLEGSTITPSKMGAVYEVNKADVICGNVQTANATVYIINKVLTPMP